ncbi:MAG: hypothetical protein ACD_15C00179G0001 [uncultured bacterium]|nr:MAG: hypothetical protein ACD_15C00179G0001 [uncultured bacterium]HCU70601.1 hypothetical protein [Candidatus Moranbacteria bacterium]
MKKYLYSTFIILSIFSFSGCSLAPEPKVGVSGGATSSIMKTIDGGVSWEAKGKTAGKVSLNSVDVLSLAINPYDGKNVFVGTLRNGILKTDNGGEDWSLLNFPAAKVYGLLIDNMQSHIMYATGVWQGYGKIFKSVDSGNEWNEIYTSPSNGPIVVSLTMDKFNSNTIYATISDRQIIKSVDGGSSWQNIFAAPGPVTKLSIDSTNPNLIYILMVGGTVMRSMDGGRTFDPITNNIGSGSETIETDPINSNTVYTGGRNGLYRSKDAGNNWEEIRVLNDPKIFPIKAIAVNPSNSGEILYGANQAVYKSIDGGQSWSSFQLETKKIIDIIRYDVNASNTAYIGLRTK